MNDCCVLQVPITNEQHRIFYEAAFLAGFRGEFADRDYLLYLLARDLTPVPGVFSYQRGQLCQRLRQTPTPAFWRDSGVAPSAQFVDGKPITEPENKTQTPNGPDSLPDGADGKASDG